MTYEEGKERARTEAIEWQREASDHNYSWYEIFYYIRRFQKKAKRYGLIKEFRENGII